MRQRTRDELFLADHFAAGPVSDYELPLNRMNFAAAYPDIVEDEHGLTPERGYLEVTARGNTSFAVTSTAALHRLLDGQRWREIHVEMYEDGIFDVPFWVLLEEMDERVLRFMARSMFSGTCEERVTKTWAEVNGGTIRWAESLQS